jgi:integrase
VCPAAATNNSFPQAIQTPAVCDTLPVATPTKVTGPRKRGPVAKRRFQKGSFQIVNGVAYSLYYEDVQQSNGPTVSRRARHLLGKIGPEGMSERSARREHDRVMQAINRKRGTVAPALRGETFGDALKLWQSAVAPNLSPATVRQRESYLRVHVLPRFKTAALHSMGVEQLQQFATDLRGKVSRKTVVNILSAVFAVFGYARRCGLRAPNVGFKDLELGSQYQDTTVPFFTRDEATRIIEAAKEPYKTLFAVAWATGMRAGEILALTRDDLDFERKTIRVNKTSDDKTREIRQPKTKNSVALLPMPSALEARLCDYLEHAWKPNSQELLFPNRACTRPRKRESVVQYALKPLLRKLGIDDRAGLHAFRHGLATELAEASVPITVLQTQMRHADVKTTLRVYAHIIPQSQREAMERASTAIGTNVPIGTVIKS